MLHKKQDEEDQCKAQFGLPASWEVSRAIDSNTIRATGHASGGRLEAGRGKTRAREVSCAPQPLTLRRRPRSRQDYGISMKLGEWT